jgi:hypothetical protein
MRKPNAIVPASQEATALRAQVAGYTDAELIAAMRITPDQLSLWNRIANGEQVPGAADVLSAIRLKLSYTVSKPAMRVVIAPFSVKDPYDGPDIFVDTTARPASDS